MAKPKKFQHGDKFSSNLMGVICGRTGAGKTHLLFKMLTTDGILDYDNLIVLTSTPEQSYYQFLKHGFDNNLSKGRIKGAYEVWENSDQDESIEDICSESVQYENNASNITCTLTDNAKIIENPNNLKSMKNLIIFDDILTMKDQTIPKMMFTKGRHNNCACLYLSQSFYDVERLIRKNANTFILFETNERNLKEICKDVNVTDEKEFKQFVKRVWEQDRFGYALVNFDKPSNERYTNSVF